MICQQLLPFTKFSCSQKDVKTQTGMGVSRTQNFTNYLEVVIFYILILMRIEWIVGKRRGGHPKMRWNYKVNEDLRENVWKRGESSKWRKRIPDGNTNHKLNWDNILMYSARRTGGRNLLMYTLNADLRKNWNCLYLLKSY